MMVPFTGWTVELKYPDWIGRVGRERLPDRMFRSANGSKLSSIDGADIAEVWHAEHRRGE